MSAGRISAATRMLAVVGDPVGHSLSPLMHNQWLAEAGIDAAYGALHLRSDEAAADLAALARAGFYGLNITLPYKAAALEAATERTREAAAIGAANTLARRADGGWMAHNTDGEGFATALRAALGGQDPGAGARVVLIGAGGAARAAVAWLASLGVSLAIVNRTEETARELAASLAPGTEIAGLSDLSRIAGEAAIVVNSASLGHTGAAVFELPAGSGRPFIDMSYGKAAAAQLAAAYAAGWEAYDGLTMLAGQAAAAFRIWFGDETDYRPDIFAAAAMCRASLEIAP